MASTMTAVILFTGEDWRASAYLQTNKGVRFHTCSSIIAGNHKVIPATVLQWCKDKGIKEITIIEPADVVSLQLELTSSLTTTERQTALKWEVASQYGDAATIAVKLSSTKATCYGTEPKSDLIFSAIFRENDIREYTENAQSYGLKLCGITSLQLSLLAALKSELTDNDNMLYVAKNKSFVYIHRGAHEISKARNIPTGFDSQSSDVSEWKAKFKNRVTTMNNCTVHTVIPHNAPLSFASDIESTLSDALVKHHPFNDIVGQMMLIVAQGSPDTTDDIAAICGTNTEASVNKGAQRNYWILTGMILIAAMCSYLFFMNNRFGKYRDICERGNAFKDQIEGCNNKLNELSKSNTLCLSLIQSLQIESRISEPFLTVIEKISTIIPTGCTVNQLSFENSTVIFEGFAKNQNSLTDFEHKITNSFRSTGILFSTQIKNKGQQKIAFTYTLSKKNEVPK